MTKVSRKIINYRKQNFESKDFFVIKKKFYATKFPRRKKLNDMTLCG